MGNSAILRINAEKSSILVNPPYQRKGEVWNLEKRQLLIDSILNNYDIPKIYFHVLPGEENEKVYAIIDGRQRLEAIWDFIEGRFPLSEDFVFLQDKNIDASKMTYPELSKKYPRLKILFDSFTLPIILVETPDNDLIEDLFSRLNEAVPLNAAEKRNAWGGMMTKLINEISEHPFFSRKVRFPNKRYQHKEVATRVIFIEYALAFKGKLIDTKKPYLDMIVKQYRNETDSDEVDSLRKGIMPVLDMMIETFGDSDVLLRSQSIVPIYYLLFSQVKREGLFTLVTRQKLLDFQEKLKENRVLAEQDISRAEFDFLEFDRLSQQGTNDASSIRERFRIICNFFGIEPHIISNFK